jgi:cyclophilin family peptidyl-prolyl cis-trans isomerase
VGTDKRARQKANRSQRIEEVQRVDRRSRITRTAIRVGVIVVVVAAAIFLYGLLSDDGDDGDQVAATTTAADGDTTTTSAAAQDAVEPVCPAEDGSGPRQTQFTAAPTTCIDPTATYLATFDTSAGTFTAEIDPALDEASANNFVFLARHHAYDGTIFHRVIDDFVVQGGDVQGLDGRGGPGYVFTGGTPTTTPYELGALAMANSEGPTTNGSQFFVVTGPRGEALPANYSLFGQVTEGLDVPLQMQTVETDEADKPIEDLVLNSVTVTEVPASS